MTTKSNENCDHRSQYERAIPSRHSIGGTMVQRRCSRCDEFLGTTFVPPEPADDQAPELG